MLYSKKTEVSDICGIILTLHCRFPRVFFQSRCRWGTITFQISRSHRRGSEIGFPIKIKGCSLYAKSLTLLPLSELWSHVVVPEEVWGTKPAESRSADAAAGGRSFKWNVSEWNRNNKRSRVVHDDRSLSFLCWMHHKLSMHCLKKKSVAIHKAHFHKLYEGPSETLFNHLILFFLVLSDCDFFSRENIR